MDLVQAPSAKATWPHDKLTTDNIVDNGLSWFEQMSSIMGNYLTGSSCHVFGQGDNDWGPFHQTIHWRSPVAYARHALRTVVQVNMSASMHAVRQYSTRMRPRNCISLSFFTLMS